MSALPPALMMLAAAIADAQATLAALETENAKLIFEISTLIEERVALKAEIAALKLDGGQ